MYWLTRPPLLRYLAAAMLIATGLAIELRPEPTLPHPFAMASIPPGTTITEADVRFRDVEAGLLPSISLPAIARVPIASGDPLIPAMLSAAGESAPEGWWSLEVPVPLGAVPGMDVLLVSDGLVEVTGMIVAVLPGDDFGGGPIGLVAVPPDSTAAIATALNENRLVPLLGG